MTKVDDLASNQGSDVPDPAFARKQLEELLNLPSVAMKLGEIRMFGQGSRATVEIDVSNGETLVWESIRDMARPASLVTEVVACTGAVPALKAPQVLRAVSFVRLLAKHKRTVSDNGHAVDWGIGYLQAADTLDIDMKDQASRWDAFQRLAEVQPVPGLGPTLGIVLRDASGYRLVRCGWFRQFVKVEDAQIGPAALATRMERVGWIKRGSEGLIKATRPSFPDNRSYSFWLIEAGWEERWTKDAE